MSRLPTPGGDDNQWGTVLNDYLGVAHNSDGTLKPLPGATLNDGTVTENKLAPGVVSKLNSSGAAPADGSITSAKLADGSVTLAKHDSTTQASLGKADSAVQPAALTAKIDKTVVTAKGDIVAASAAGTPARFGVGTDGQVLVADSASATGLNWTTPAAGAGDATTSANGVVRLAGDLAGTASAPTVAKVNGIAVTGTPTSGQVLTASSASAAAWSTPAAGAGDATTGAKGIVQLAGDLAGTAAAPTVPNMVNKTVATTKGDLLAATAASTIARLGVGTNGQVLAADSTAATGLAWTTPAAGAGDATNSTKGIVQLAGDLAGTAAAPTVPGKVDKSTVTTKGDLYVATAASTPARLAVGANNQVLTADSTAASGVKWAAVPTNGMTATAKTANYTAVANDLVLVDASSGNVTVALPAATASTQIAVKKTDTSANTVTVMAVGSDTIGVTAGTSVVLRNRDETRNFVGQTGNWVIIGNFGFYTNLLAWAYASAYDLATVTRDGTTDAITTASVVWPDGATGTFTTTTASSAFPGAIDAYTITHVLGGATRTITQTAVTRNANGSITAQPALTIS